ncbi:N-acetylmuramoyl-L-alanine amidase [Dethiosulfovibrio sp. F2B]|uniref:N-acetylmuramoyl-L-alanine amidase family protein n=1 Tax=Dethiosulfovibrio faecalis TaxID=2720018 RepID=UPI001F2C12F8|nr:N-acetylmuramoyl-L-alanine amidase [Dethiosulfovibrio faecalis]MCF4152676.1 N-acetylmuramoyl-L-alanine amidase [Dethiosulfovibrio faecalis]
MSRWLGPKILITVLCVFLLAGNAWAGWMLSENGKPVGDIPVREQGADVFVSIGEMARQLECYPKTLNDGLLVRKGSASIQVVPNAAAVWLGYEIIPLRRKAFLADQRWWMDSESALLVMEKLLTKSGEKVRLKWNGVGNGGSTPSEEPLPVSVKPVEPEPRPFGGSGSVGNISVRWGNHEDRVRMVLEYSGKLSYREIPGGVELETDGRIATVSPDPSVSVKTVSSKGRWRLSAVASGWVSKSFELESPRRLVIDFMRPSSSVAPEKPVPASPKPAPISHKKPARKGKPLVVIDAGHGGKDPGAVANGYREKIVALQIAKRLASHVRALGMDARLTRDDDRYLKLNTRTTLANRWDADAFVSVHLNALPKGRHAKGVEIYIMALPTDKDAMALAKIENAEIANGSNGNGGDKTDILLSILGDMQQNNKIQESTSFAEALFSSGKNGGLPMRRVAQAPFYVLRGAAMPAVLVETGFISEKSEAKLLANPSYQEKLAKALAKGIAAYLK